MDYFQNPIEQKQVRRYLHEKGYYDSFDPIKTNKILWNCIEDYLLGEISAAFASRVADEILYTGLNGQKDAIDRNVYKTLRWASELQHILPETSRIVHAREYFQKFMQTKE